MYCKSGQFNTKIDKIETLQNYFKALHCPIRWVIISIIGHGKKGTNEIYEGVTERGETLAKSSLYYHLSELRSAGIIEVADYKEEVGGAPEKLWSLKTTEIRINLLEDLG
ncbi:ArsR family transcriptional regulator [Candidatus Bathyarchaeota archaeon]|nr:ArsR family transcriptional regulator [Candidatus Bathyarchaeota archaeon]